MLEAIKHYSLLIKSENIKKVFCPMIITKRSKSLGNNVFITI